MLGLIFYILYIYSDGLYWNNNTSCKNFKKIIVIFKCLVSECEVDSGTWD